MQYTIDEAITVFQPGYEFAFNSYDIHIQEEMTDE